MSILAKEWSGPIFVAALAAIGLVFVLTGPAII